ncbi:hypothetical protein PRZ48_014965 [Zasmidium cellare]|uniref:BTB domain-containing protein n=1 Tax=Zasmidium cellare TaxID=395010 RepID=A0ABR0DXQ7_ZASCE|nr:hypothetical protein PRZ48_014965 [Zasmidium cellare]
MASGIPLMPRTVAANGDLLLEVGTSPKIKLLVSSQVLTAASKVFGALLGPKFLEGQSTRSPQSPQTISLPDDDPEDMHMVCRLLHGAVSPDELSHITDLEILHLAIPIDKYGLSKSLQFHNQALLLTALRSWDRNTTLSGDEMTCLATAAYLMERPDYFTNATRRLIGETVRTADASILVSQRIYDFLPGPVLDIIESKRIVAREKIVHDVPQLLAPRCQIGCTLSCAADLTPVLKAFGVKFWPAKRLTIQEAIEGIRKLIGVDKGRCESLPRTFRSNLISPGDVKGLIDQLMGMCEGLCLHCVREGKDLQKKCEDKEHAA